MSVSGSIYGGVPAAKPAIKPVVLFGKNKKKERIEGTKMLNYWVCQQVGPQSGFKKDEIY